MNYQSKLLMIVGVLIALVFVAYVNWEKPAAASEQVTLDFWNIQVPGDEATNAVLAKVQKTLIDENPNISINFTSMDGNVYKTKIKAALAANKAPDIFYTWLPGFAQEFVATGSVTRLNNLLSPNAKLNLNMTAINSGNRIFNGIYALPIEVKMGILYCNQQLFDHYGIKIPDTYDELLTAVDQFNSHGVQPILAPGKRSWPIMWLYDILALKAAGLETVTAALKKESPFDQPEFLQAAHRLQELVDHNAFGNSALLLDNNEANELFFSGQSPMYFMGSWIAASAVEDGNAIAGNVVAKRFPALGNDFDRHMLGGTGDGFMVAQRSKHKKEAVRILERFIQLMSESETVLFPVWNVAKDYSQLDPVFEELNQLYYESEGFVIWWDTYLNEHDAKLHKDLVVKLFAKQINTENFITDMQAISTGTSL